MAPSFYNLTLANGNSSRFTISNSAGVNVASVLTLNNGITTTSTYPAVTGAIRLTSTGTQAAVLAGNTPSVTTYVDGYVGKAGTANTFTYPLGATNSNSKGSVAIGTNIYSPITISKPGSTAVRYIAGSTPSPTSYTTQAAPLQLTTVTPYEYYPIGTIGTLSGATITLPYNNFGAIGNQATLTIAAFNGTKWTNLSATANNVIDAVNHTVTVTLVKDLNAPYTNYIALALANTIITPLPVQLVTFTVLAVHNHDALLSWTTASEVNNDHFEVERSLDGTSFVNIGQVQGQGTKATATDYTLNDANGASKAAGVVYYRLKQVDVDGTAVYSPTRMVSFTQAATVSMGLYPNPISRYSTLDLNQLPATSRYTVLLLDATGRSIRTWTLSGGQSQTLDMVDIATGTYQMLVTEQQPDGSVLRQSLRLTKE